MPNLAPRLALLSLLAALLAGCAIVPGHDDDGGGDGDSGGGPGGGGSGGGGGCAATDSDGDGWADDVERAMETAPDDPADNPDARGELVFVMPHGEEPRPAHRDVSGEAALARADVLLLLDTTGSMAGTASRIQGQFRQLITMLAGEVDDLAFGAAGYGDFPWHDGANSQYDVPFYLVHRVMTARTEAGLASIAGAMQYRNIITDGLGPWFAAMRGGDEPEQGWEALRQAATGVGITYPSPFGGTGAVPPFDPDAAYPSTPPAGEEVGATGGVGFRDDSVPIVIMITDTEHHDAPVATTTPAIAGRSAAYSALEALGARVIGLMAWKVTGHDDLQAVAAATGARVAPSAWGAGSERPGNCPADRCCLVAEDPDTGWVEEQPAPVGGMCTLVFRSDRYDTNLAEMIAQAVIAIARGGVFDIGAELRDVPEEDGADEVDVAAAFVERIEAVREGACAGLAAEDLDGDGALDTFVEVEPGASVCFRITARQNTEVAAAAEARAYRGELRLTGDGVAGFGARPVWFVVPGSSCDPGGGVVD